jgi:hypothetical protein
MGIIFKRGTVLRERPEGCEPGHPQWGEETLSSDQVDQTASMLDPGCQPDLWLLSPLVFTKSKNILYYQNQ